MEHLKKCKLCKSNFTAKGNQLFCSKVCQNNYRNLKRKRTPIEFNCLICGVTFNQKRKDNTTC